MCLKKECNGLLPYVSYDEKPFKSEYGISEKEILFPRNIGIRKKKNA